MDNLLKQSRTRFSGATRESKNELDRGRDQNIQFQKTRSFKEKKKGQNWFQRQFSRQMSREFDASNGIEQATAVAAAAYAINSLRESGILDLECRTEKPETSVIKIKSKQEDKTVSIPETGRVSNRFSGSKEILEDKDRKIPVTAASDRKTSEKNILSTPSIKKPPTFSDKQSSQTSSVKPESSTPKSKFPSSAVKPAVPPNLPTAVKPEPPPIETERQSSPKPRMKNSNADIWEDTEIAKIQKRYEERNAIIDAWEDKKKMKAGRKLEKKESEPESKRAKALKKFQKDMQYIDQVARLARAKTVEWRRNKMLKVIEMANVIRQTGKVPTTCFCC